MNSKLPSNYLKHQSRNALQKYFINRFYGALLTFVRLADPSGLADVGCGEGFTLERIRNSGYRGQVVGIDNSDEALLLGKGLHPDFDLRKGDIYRLPFHDKSFDLVLCNEVLEHLENPRTAVAELMRVSRKHLLLSVPNEPFFMLANLLRGKNISRFGNDSDHRNHWSTAGFTRFLHDCGLTIRKVTAPFPWTLVLAQTKK